jgi:AcrR family transcriptional regulator
MTRAIGKVPHGRPSGASAARTTRKSPMPDDSSSDTSPLRPRDPERTKAAILAAATEEFAAKGIGGARVDAIARGAGTNKRMLYHYFGDKEGLYISVLEQAYAQIREAEKSLDLAQRSPEEGLKELALFTWRYFLSHPEFLSLLGTENLHRASHVRRSSRIREMQTHLVTELAGVLRRGEAEGVFAEGNDPLQVYLMIASICYFYLTNQYTLSAVFGRELMHPHHLADWERQIVRVALAAVKP